MADDESTMPGDDSTTTGNLTPLPEDVLLHILPLLPSPDLARVARLNSFFHSLTIPFLYKTVTLGGEEKRHSITHTVDFIRRQPELVDKATTLRIGVHPHCDDAPAEGFKVLHDPLFSSPHPHQLPRLRNIEHLDIAWYRRSDASGDYSSCPFLKPFPTTTRRDIPLVSYLGDLVYKRKLSTLVLRTKDIPPDPGFPFLDLIHRAGLNRLKKFVVVAPYSAFVRHHESYLAKGRQDWDELYPALPLSDLAEWIATMPPTIHLTIVDMYWAIYQYSDYTEATAEQHFRNHVSAQMWRRGKAQVKIEARQAAIRIVNLVDYSREMGCEMVLDRELEQQLADHVRWLKVLEESLQWAAEMEAEGENQVAAEEVAAEEVAAEEVAVEEVAVAEVTGQQPESKCTIS